MADRPGAFLSAAVIALVLIVLCSYGIGIACGNTGTLQVWKVSKDLKLANPNLNTKIPGTFNPGTKGTLPGSQGGRVETLDMSRIKQNPGYINPGKTIMPPKSQDTGKVKPLDPNRYKDPAFIDPNRLKGITPPDTKVPDTPKTPGDNAVPKPDTPKAPDNTRPPILEYPVYREVPVYVPSGGYYPQAQYPTDPTPYSNDLPDLRPLPKYEGKEMGGAGYAHFDDAGNFIVRVQDLGAPCGPSMVTVNFGNVQVKGAVMAFERGYGDINDAIIQVPSGVWKPDMPFTITVDSDKSIAEANEDNNVAKGVAIG